MLEPLRETANCACSALWEVCFYSLDCGSLSFLLNAIVQHPQWKTAYRRLQKIRLNLLKY